MNDGTVDLLSAVIEFEPRRPVDLGRGASGHAVHAAFLDQVRRTDPALAERLHVRAQCKPFAVSPIFARPEQGGARYWFRLAALTAEAARAVHSFQTGHLSDFPLLGETMHLVSFLDAGHPWAGRESSSTLLRGCLAAPPPSHIAFEFVTPTRVEADDDSRALFPEPELVFRGLAEKWSRFCPHHSDEVGDRVRNAAELARTALRVSRYELATAPVHARRGPAMKIGYVGTVRYEIRARGDDLTARVLHALAAYAFYAGVGYGTPRGMGQARAVGTEKGRIEAGRGLRVRKPDRE